MTIPRCRCAKLQTQTELSGFEPLTAAKYDVRAHRAFYIDVSYGEHWPGGRGQSLEVADGKTAPLITIKMVPQAVISGVLVDADADPVQGAQIELLKERWKEGKRTPAPVDETRTDDQGRYRFARLVAGTYFLRAVPAWARTDAAPLRQQFLDQNRQPFRRVEGRTYYKDSISFRDATRIRVGVGQEISNLTLALRATEARHVSGQVAPEVLNTSPRVLYLFHEESGSPGVWSSIPIQNDRHFVADGLFPDHYVIQGPSVIRKEIDLTNGDIDDLALEAKEPIELQITVHVQDGNSHPPIRSLALVDKTPGISESIRAMEVEFVSENRFKSVVFAGRYEIGQSGDGAAYFIRGLTVDGEPQPRNSFEVTGGARKSIELFLSSNFPIVEGHVTGDRSLEGEATLLLEDESDPESLPTKQSRTDGTFQYTLLHAGRYRLYAFEEFNRDAWGNPELAALFAAKSLALEVKEGQHLQVSLPLISAEEFEAAVRKTGF